MNKFKTHNSKHTYLAPNDGGEHAHLASVQTPASVQHALAQISCIAYSDILIVPITQEPQFVPSATAWQTALDRAFHQISIWKKSNVVVTRRALYEDHSCVFPACTVPSLHPRLVMLFIIGVYQCENGGVHPTQATKLSA